MLLAACGSRANQAQVVGALGAGGGTGGARTTGGGGTAEPEPVLTVQALAALMRRNRDGLRGGRRRHGANAAPPGGNGGATDVGVATADSITVANISIVTGPVPGLFVKAPKGGRPTCLL